MQLLKNRDFGDFFSDTFQFFKENFKGLILNYFKLQGILLILLIIVGYFYMNMMNEFMLSNPAFNNPNPTPEEAMGMMQSMMGMYLNLPFLMLMIIGSLAGIVSANYIPIYMELYNTKQGDFGFNDIVDKFKENIGKILMLTLALVLLAIPIYIVLFIAFFITVFTLIGWIFVLGFVVSYFSQIWFYSGHYKAGAFSTLGNTFSLFKDNFWKMVGATTVLLLIFTLTYYILSMVIVLLVADSSITSSVAENPMDFYSGEMLIFMIVFQLFGIFIGTIITLLVQIQQGMMFYSRVNDIDQISEHEDINSIGNNPPESDHSSFIQSH